MNPCCRFSSLFLLLTSIALSLLLSTAHLAAEPQSPDSAEVKIRLLSEALHARDTGDKDTARKYLQELLALSPLDETVKRLLANIDKTPEKKVIVSGGVVAPGKTLPPASLASEADRLAHEEETRLSALVTTARTVSRNARALAIDKHFSEAIDRVERTLASLPENSLTQDIIAELGITKAEIIAACDKSLGQIASAVTAASVTPAGRPATVTAPTESGSVSERKSGSPVMLVPALANPAPATKTAANAWDNPEMRELLSRGRFQFVAGESAAAAQSFARVLEQDPENAEAKRFLQRIAAHNVDGNSDRIKTNAQLLNEVSRAWQRPGVYQEKVRDAASPSGPSPLLEKLNGIILPSVNFSGMELSRVVNTLSVISEEFDKTGTTPKGVNIVLLDQSNTNPTVNLTLRNLSLKRVLDFITDATGYQYEVQADAVVVRPGGEQSAFGTQFFPVSRSTVLRMTGKAAGHATPVGGADPLATTGATAGGSSIEGEGQAIKSFLQLAGVSFDEAKGSTLAFDGSQLIVTQSPRNMERIRNILNRYNDVRQVEIEAKFMEVQEGALEELGVQWNIGKKATQHSGASVTNYQTSNRSLESNFNSNSSASQGQVIRPSEKDLPIINNPPPVPGTNLLGVGANALANVTGIIGEFNVNAVVRTLSQKSGTELLSAPKLTVLSGNSATITVAQELRYPQSYGQVQAQVGTGSASGGGSAGVAITAGTPQEFTTRNVGVELKVTPTVEEDDYSISLDLNPKVTEFEGFVEYGGQSIAIAGNPPTTVTVPSGFYQPIFGVREMNTKVTIWDGATLIMGGLTRQDVKRVNDKVPVLGNLPAIGRLFRSDGESSQKRNLLVFVTANLVSPGGSLKQQTVRDVPAGTLFQNPTIVTPTGTLPRGTKGK